jgi:colicin import membrane protein
MSTVVESQASPSPEKEDPWRYGWRYVQRVAPDGTEYSDQVPLRQEDLLYPEEGDFVVNNMAHHDDCHYLGDILRARVGGRKDMLVLSDHRIDWEVVGLCPLGPDVVVFEGLRQAWDPNRETFPVRTFGARTLLVIEVTSADSRVYDLGIKRDFYRRVGAEYYAVVDRPEASGGPDMRLLGFRADAANPQCYSEVPLDEQGRLWMESVGLWLRAENRRVVLYEKLYRRIPDYAEAVQATQQAQTRAEAAEARLKEMEAELQRLREEKKP